MNMGFFLASRFGWNSILLCAHQVSIELNGMEEDTQDVGQIKPALC